MAKNHIHAITDELRGAWENLTTQGFVESSHHKEYIKYDLHSWLQYTLIIAGNQLGLLAIPEIKLRFDQPLDPKQCGLTAKKRKRGFSRVDIAFYDSYGGHRRLLGISEVFTMDTAHGALSSSKMAKDGDGWLTPRDSLPYLIRHAYPEKPAFIILVLAMSKEASNIKWKTNTKIDQLLKNKSYYEVFKPLWQDFNEKLRSETGVESSLVIVSEDAFECL